MAKRLTDHSVLTEVQVQSLAPTLDNSQPPLTSDPEGSSLCSQVTYAHMHIFIYKHTRTYTKNKSL